MQSATGRRPVRALCTPAQEQPGQWSPAPIVSRRRRGLLGGWSAAFGWLRISWSILLALVGLACALGPACVSGDVIQLGAVLPLSGTYAGAGFRAWLILNQSLADMQANPNTKILAGSTIELIVADSTSTVAGATAATLALEARGVKAILTGFESMQNQNTTQLSAAARAILTRARAPGAGGGNSAAAAAAGVGATGTALADAVASVAHALASDVPVIVPTSTGCLDSLTDHPDNFLPLCSSKTDIAQGFHAVVSALGWTRISVVSQESLMGSWNSRYAASVFGSTNGLGYQGGGATQQNTDSGFADALLNELSDNTDSRVKKADWPYPTLTAINRYRLPNVPLEIPDAIQLVLSEIRDSRLFVIVVLLSGSTLQSFLQQAYLAGMLGQGSPYVWIGLGESAKRESSAGVIEGDGSFASRGVGSGLCSSHQAAQIQAFQNAVISQRIASGDLSSTSTISSSSMIVTPTATVDNPVASYATSNPLGGTICVVPSTPTTVAWGNLRYRLIAGGLPTSTILDAHDGATYDAPFLFAHGYLNSLQSPGLSRSLAPYIRNLSIDLLSDHWSWDDNGRQPTVDILNFEQLDSGSLCHFPRRGTYREFTGNLTLTDSPIIFGNGRAAIPEDFISIEQEGSDLAWSVPTTTTVLQFVLLLLASGNFAMYVFKAKKWDTSIVDQRAQIASNLARAALGYSSLVFLGHIMLGLSYLHIESVTTDPQFLTLAYFLSWLLGFLLVYLGLLVAASQNGSKVEYYKISRIRRYEIAGKSGVAGGGGGSGVNFVSSESGDSSGVSAGATHHVSPIHLGGTGRPTPYGNHKRAHSLSGIHMVKQVPLWSRALEECYITLVLCFTSWRMVLGGVLLMLGNEAVFQFNLVYQVLPSWVRQTSDISTVGVAIFLIFLHAISLTIIFREARRWKQFVGVAWITLSNLAGFYMLMSSVQYTYALGQGTSHINHAVAYWGPSDTTLVLFILIAGSLLTSLALIIDILQLSRGILDQVLLTAKSDLAKLEGHAAEAKEVTKERKLVSEYLRRILELINLIRPLHRNLALAFALAEVADPSGKRRVAVIPPCFDQADRVANTVVKVAPSADVSKVGPAHSPSKLASNGQAKPSGGVAGSGGMVVLPGSRQPSGGMESAAPTLLGHHERKDSHDVPNVPLGTSTGIIAGAGYEDLDFSFLARAKNEAAGMKLLQELSERLFLATGPVHHRAVADIQLAHILGHPVTLELFKDSIQRSSAQANLAFWLDIQRWRGLDGPEAKKLIATAMFQTFLAENRGAGVASLPGTQLLSTVKSGTKLAIHQSLQSGTLPASLFDDVESEILFSLQKEMLSFSGTTAFKIAALILGHSAYQPDTKLQPVVRQKAAAPPSALTGAITGTRGRPASKGNKEPSSLNTQERSTASDHVGPSVLVQQQGVVGVGVGVQIHLYADGESDSPNPLHRRTSGTGNKRPSQSVASPSNTLASPTPAHQHASGSVEMQLLSPNSHPTTSSSPSLSPPASPSTPLDKHHKTTAAAEELVSPSPKSLL